MKVDSLVSSEKWHKWHTFVTGFLNQRLGNFTVSPKTFYKYQQNHVNIPGSVKKNYFFNSFKFEQEQRGNIKLPTH